MEFRVVRETRRHLPMVAWSSIASHVTRGERTSAHSSVALILTTPKHIALLNQRYHHGRGPTDVLAFPVGIPVQRGSGDIVICPAILAQRNPHTPFAALLAHRFAHALLHLHGYRHDTLAQHRLMERRTRHYITLTHPQWLQSLPKA